MTRRRWIADEFSRDRAALTDAHAAHLSRILRARVGQEFEVACGDQVRRATVTGVTDDRVEFALGEEIAASAAVPITLLLAIFKFDRMEWAIEKCTELNVTTIVPVIGRRTEKHLAIAAEKRVERWRRIAREASEQSRRISPPEIFDPLKLKDALVHVPGAGVSNTPAITSEHYSLSRGTCGPPGGDLRVVLAETERGVRFNQPNQRLPQLSQGIEPREKLSESSQDVARNEELPEPARDMERGEKLSGFPPDVASSEELSDSSRSLESPENQPRRGGIEFSPGRKPWVGAQIEPSPVGTAQRASDLRIVLAESERELELAEVLRSHSNPASLALAIGPEGGWAEDELQSFASLQWIAASLGETILRAETAAIAALAIARAEI